MFNATFKNIAQSALLATLVATTLSAVPAIAGDGGGNLDRFIKAYNNQADDQDGAEDQYGSQIVNQYNSEPFTHTGILAEEDDTAYGVDASYRTTTGWSASFDR